MMTFLTTLLRFLFLRRSRPQGQLKVVSLGEAMRGLEGLRAITTECLISS
jgi:hypothetical protein